MGKQPFITRALSIRQPMVEQILRGDKKLEYRSTPTNIRERVYLYAAVTPKDSPDKWKQVGKQPGELPVGVIVGSVEITDCKPHKEYGFVYELSAPRRLKKPIKALNKPLPKFWKPVFE